MSDEAKEKKTWRAWCGALLPVLLTAIVLIGLKVEGPLAWLLTAMILSIYICILGKAITLQWLGVFIDERNKVSMSRLQMATWTVVVISGFFVMALMRLKAGTDQIIAPIPDQLLVLLGIGTGSLVASPVIKTSNRSTLHSNSTSQEARFTDVFKTERIGEKGLLDLPKVQMFFFTVVAVFVYCAMLWKMFTGQSGYYLEFPPLTEKLLWLLGISHAGYLTGKAVELH
jgi:hypothetical protein